MRMESDEHLGMCARGRRLDACTVGGGPGRRAGLAAGTVSCSAGAAVVPHAAASPAWLFAADLRRIVLGLSSRVRRAMRR